MSVPIALTIAGSDTSGGAGMQADIKTFQEYGVYGLVALTAIVTMDPDNNWAHDVTPIDPEVVRKQLKTIMAADKIDALKTGMLATADMVRLVYDTINESDIINVVVDPVMVCKGENSVLNPECADAIRELLIPLATVATPNLFEAGILARMDTPTNFDEMKEAAKRITDMGACSVIVKGGKALADTRAVDIFYDGEDFEILMVPKVEPSFNHGAGCSFGAAIAAGLAKGSTVREAARDAKTFVTAAIKHGFMYNKYIGPVFHGGIRLDSIVNDCFKQ